MNDSAHHNDHHTLFAVSETFGAEMAIEAKGVLILEAEVDDVTVVALVEPTGRKKTVRVRTPVKGAGDLKIKLYPEGFGSSLSKVFGTQDIEVGESRFDARYMIKASDEGLARLWLDFDVRRLIARSHPEGASDDFLLQIESERASIKWREATLDQRRIEETIRAVAALGRRSKCLLSECRELAMELGGTLSSASDVWKPNGAVTIRIPLGELLAKIDYISVALEARKPSLHTRIICESSDNSKGAFAICRPNAQSRLGEVFDADLFSLTSSEKEVSFNFWIGADSYQTFTTRLSPDMSRALLEAMPTAVTSRQGKVTIWLAGFQHDLVRLRRVMTLLEIMTGQKVTDNASRGIEVRTHRRTGARSPADSPAPKTPRYAPPRSLLETWERTSLASACEIVSKASSSGFIVKIKKVRVELSEFATVDGPYHMRLEAPSSGAWGLDLRVIEGSLDPFGSLLGAQDLEVGSGWFDEHYVIKSNDIGYAKLWLQEEILGAIGRTFDPAVLNGYTYRIFKERVLVERGERERDPTRLEHALLATVAFSARSRAIVDECQELAAALKGSVIGSPERWSAESGVSISIGQGLKSVTIGQSFSESFSKRPILMTRVNVARHASGRDRYLICKREVLRRARKLLDIRLSELEAEDANYALLYWAGGENNEALKARLDPRTQSRLVLTEPEALVATQQEITLWFRGFAKSITQMQRVLAILDALGEGVTETGQAGPYR
jgi:hypothetical protein